MSDYNGGAPLWARFVNNAGQTRRPSLSPGWAIPSGAMRLPPPAGAPEGCPLPCDWDSRSFAALDVETTGLDAYKDRVIEIGLLLFHYDAEGALVEENAWNSLVNPGMPIPASSTAIHGITDLDISSAPFFAELADSLEVLLTNRVMVAHNAPFDSSFIQEEYFRLKRSSPISEMADSLVLLRQAFPNLYSYSLGKAAFVFGMETGTAHRALDDARVCMQLFTKSARILAGTCA
jgi:DNA polymerase III subunit epsilon